MVRLMALFALVWAIWTPIAHAKCDERSTDQAFGRAVALAAAGTPWDAQWQIFKANIAKDPSLCIDYFTYGERRNEETMFHDLKRNRAQIGGMSLTGLSVTLPELTIAMAPFLFESTEEVDFVYDNYLYDIANEIAGRKNLLILRWVEVGWSNIYSNRPVLLPSDVQGMRLRGSPNLAAQMFLERLGADSIPLGSSDIVPALQTGLIEGGLSSTVFHFFTTRKFASDFTLTRHAYDTGAVVVNKTWWDSLTPAQKKTVGNAWPGPEIARGGVRGLVAFSLDTMAKEEITIHTLTPEQRAAWVEVTAPMHEEMIRTIGGDTQRVYDRILEGKRAFREMKAAEAAAGGQP